MLWFHRPPRTLRDPPKLCFTDIQNPPSAVEEARAVPRDSLKDPVLAPRRRRDERTLLLAEPPLRLAEGDRLLAGGVIPRLVLPPFAASSPPASQTAPPPRSRRRLLRTQRGIHMAPSRGARGAGTRSRGQLLLFLRDQTQEMGIRRP